jgi:hypothetical protein
MVSEFVSSRAYLAESAEPQDQTKPMWEMAIDYVRKWLDGAPIDALDGLGPLVDEAGEPELAIRVAKLAQARRKLN